MRRRMMLVTTGAAMAVFTALSTVGSAPTRAASLTVPGCSTVSGSTTGTVHLKNCNIAGSGGSGSVATSGSSVAITWGSAATTEIVNVVVVKKNKNRCTLNAVTYQASGVVTADTTGSLLGDELSATYCVKPSGKLTTPSALKFLPLTQIAVAPVDPSTTQGGTVGFSAAGSYAKGPSQVLTTIVTWTSSQPFFASISNASGTNGVATAATGPAGSTQIQASLDGLMGSTTLTVTCRLHSNGLGQQYTDCTPLATFTATTATEAAAAWAPVGLISTIQCGVGGNVAQAIENKSTSGADAVWVYSATGSFAASVGHVSVSPNGACPTISDPGWD